MKYQFSSYDIGYPLYGAKFLNNSILLVTGGGGHKNPDVPSKLTALRVDFNKKRVIKRFREVTFDSKDDHPTTLDAAEVINQGPLHNIILIGCNEDGSSSTATTNYHLRKFAYENDHLKFMASADFNRSNDPAAYTKFSSLSSDGTVGAIASSELPIVIRIINPMTMEEKYEIETGGDVKDLHFSPDGKVICYITETTLEVISIVTGRFIVRKTDFNKNICLSKVHFLSNDVVVVVGSLKEKSKKIVISKINIKSKNTAVLLSKSIKSNYTSITAMDSSRDGQLICLATNERTLLILKSKDFTVLRSFKNAHKDDITAVVFSPDTHYLASVSLANTIYLVNLPQGLAEFTSFLSKLFKLLLNILLTVGIIVVAYAVYYFELHHKTYHYFNEKYLAKRDTSGYFQMHDGFLTTSMDIIDDIVTVHTLTGNINTESGVNTNMWSRNIPLSSISADYENKMFDNVENTFTTESHVLSGKRLSPSWKSESSTSLSPSNMDATTSLYFTSSSLPVSVSSITELISTKNSAPASSKEGYLSIESHAIKTYTSVSDSVVSSCSQSLQEVELLSTIDSKSKSSSTNVSQNSRKTKSCILSSSTISDEKMQSSVLSSSTNNQASENISSSIKRTITVDGVVYEVISMSSILTTSSFEVTAKETSNIVSPEVLITDELVSGDYSSSLTSTNIESISTIIASARLIPEDEKYNLSNSEPMSILMTSDSTKNFTSSLPVTQLTTSNGVTLSNPVSSYEMESEAIAITNSEKVSFSSVSMVAMANANTSRKLSLSERKKHLSVSFSTSVPFDATITDKESQSMVSHPITDFLTGVSRGDGNSVVWTSVIPNIENSSLRNILLDQTENLSSEQNVTSSFLNTLPSKSVISSKLDNNTVIVNKTESYTCGDVSLGHLVDNTLLVTSSIYKNGLNQASNSAVESGKLSGADLLSTVIFTSQENVTMLSVQNNISTVLELGSIKKDLKNVTMRVSELSSDSIPESIPTISQVSGSDSYSTNTVDLHTLSNITFIASSGTISVFSDSLIKTQSNVVVGNTKDIDHSILSIEIDKEVNVDSITFNDSDNVVVNQTFNQESFYPRHDEL